jgi:hypothetical protein
MHGFANPARFLRMARWLMPLMLVPGFILAFGAVAWGLFMVPPDRLMGDTVRILFIHVPSAWLGMAGWSTIAIASLVELVWRHPLAGIAARAAAVPGAAFTAICLATGSIWARPTWGTWWVWDGRLTSFLILLFLYFGYIALGGAAQRDAAAGEGASRITAIFGLVGAVTGCGGAGPKPDAQRVFGQETLERFTDCIHWISGRPIEPSQASPWRGLAEKLYRDREGSRHPQEDPIRDDESPAGRAGLGAWHF